MEFVNKISLDERKEILKNSLSFPVYFEDNDKALIRMNQLILDFDKISFEENYVVVNEDNTLTKYNILNHDLDVVLPLLKELQEEMLLNKFDRIRIYRYGLLILEIKLSSNLSRRYVYLDINHFQERIKNHIEKRNFFSQNQIVVILLTTIFTLIILSK
jgi:hypothetical protein